MLYTLWEAFSTAQFVPHGMCLLWRPDLLLMHGVSDLLIAIAYFTIPLLIFKAVRARPDLLNVGVARMFAAFILACGFSHIGALVTLWFPAYGLQGIIKMLTAAISIYTAIQLFRLLPVFLSMPTTDQVKRLGQENQQHVQLAKKASAEKDKLNEFASIVSHDLRSPMRGISNSVDFLIEDHSDILPKDAMRRLDRIKSLCAYTDNLVSTLLDYARLGLDKKHETVDVTALVNGIRESLEETLSIENATISIQPNIPKLEANPTEFATLLRNLIVNGITYNTSQRKEIQIGYLSQANVGGIEHSDVFYIKDNGIGIEPELHTEIFKIFKRAHTQPDFGQSTGAGLAFVWKIIENAGGAIALNSTPGKGSTFFFSFSKRVERSKA